MSQPDICDPPLPSGAEVDVYLDTSVLRYLISYGKNTRERTKAELNKVNGQWITSDYVIFELKRALLLPIYTLYYILEEKQNVEDSFEIFNQEFGGRSSKTMVSLLTNFLKKVDDNYLLAQAKLLALADHLEKEINNTCKVISNKTGCPLHKPKFDVETNYVDKLTCKEDCKVQEFWKSNKAKLKKIVGFDNSKASPYKLKKWLNENEKYFEELLKNPSYGKSKKLCPQNLGDILIFNYSPVKKTIIVAVDNSFPAMNISLKYNVHQMDSVLKTAGGNASTIAKKAFSNKKGSTKTTKMKAKVSKVSRKKN